MILHQAGFYSLPPPASLLYDAKCKKEDKERRKLPLSTLQNDQEDPFNPSLVKNKDTFDSWWRRINIHSDLFEQTILQNGSLLLGV